MNQDFEIEFLDGKKTLVKYSGNDHHVNIPEGVEVIGVDAFRGCDRLESISILEGVKEIKEYAFLYCVSLKNIHIPGSVKIISSGSFGGCNNISSVVIEEGVKEVEEIAFGVCTSLKHVKLPKSLTTIGNRAFEGCTNLISVIIPNGVEEIGEDAFDKSTRLEVEIIYQHQSSLKIETWYRDGVILLQDGESRLIGKLFIADNIPGPEFLENLIDGCVDHLSEYDALFSLSNDIVIRKLRAALFRLEYPLELNEEYMLIYSTYLRNHGYIIVPFLINEGDIGSISILAENDALLQGKIDRYIEQAIELSQLEILAYLMDYKNKTWGINYHISLELNETPVADWETLENWDGTLTIRKYLGIDSIVTIPSKLNGKHVSRIEGNLGSLKVSIFFYNKQRVQSVIIEDGVDEIGDRAFLECSNLESVYLPASVTRIGQEAFAGCTKLTKLTVPESVTKIGQEAFASCKSLKSIMIPESVNEISDDAFNGCDNLEIASPQGSYAIEFAERHGLAYERT